MLVGVIHLPPSMGTPGFRGMGESMTQLVADLDALEHSGVDGILLENENDKPHTLLVNTEQVAWLTRVAIFARDRTAKPLGISVQRIDWEATFAIAACAQLNFCRLDTLVDRVRMGGELVALEPQQVMAKRPPGVKVLVDVHVKHAELVDNSTIRDSARRAVECGADTILVTGNRTGEPPAASDLSDARIWEPIGPGAARPPVWIGSGLHPSNAAELAQCADGAVVGTSLMTDGHIDLGKAYRMVEAWRRACALRR